MPNPNFQSPQERLDSYAMKLSLNWLSDFVIFQEQDPQEIAEKLTLSVAEVKRVEVQGELLEHCVVGKVLSVEKHPNADALFLCNVATDKGTKRVVCGGTNLRKGMLVAFAHVGARVKWHGGKIQELKKARIRGEESAGMICTAEELELREMFPDAIGRSIVDLSNHTLEAGQPLREALGLGDTIFHIDNTAITHRADLFSHIGVARECVALGIARWKKKSPSKAPRFTKDAIPFRLIVQATHLMPRYCACMIHIDALGETPTWMVRRLEAVGWRPINLPIDITNYVATEVGVPLHSFDANDIHGTVHMRTARAGERIVTLDRREFSLPDGALVLSDDEGVFDLLGIMGGLRSSTKKTTRNIYLHSASLDPISIRKAVITTGHRTDAATVYEKGVPYVTTEQGFYRAIELFLELVPGARIMSKQESYGTNGKAQPISLSLDRASSLLGRTISSKEASRVLAGLGFAINQKLVVRAPLHRLGDIQEEADLIEEIARIGGFHTYEPELPIARITSPRRDNHIHCLRDTLKELGFAEVVQLALLGPTLMKKSGGGGPLQEIANPLGEDLMYVRSSLRPRLLECAEENISLPAGKFLRIFEVGHVFQSQEESLHLTLLVTAKHEGNLKDEPFLLAKGTTTVLLSTIGLSPTWRESHTGCGPYVHPARRLEVRVGKALAGAVYEVHPAVCRNFGLSHRTAIATLDLTALLAQPLRERTYQEIPAFPEISYDVTVPVPRHKGAISLLSKIQGSHMLLREAKLIDIFQRGTECRLTFRCTYGAPDRTLTEEEVKPVHESIEVLLRGSS